MTTSDPLLLTEEDLVGLTLWGEARNQPIEGIYGVGNVIRNRHDHWGQTYQKVCLAPRQFSCWNPGDDTNHIAVLAHVSARVQGTPVTDQSLLMCLYLGAGIVSRVLMRDNTGGALWYLTQNLFRSDPPIWAKGAVPVATLGDHVFFAILSPPEGRATAG